MRGIQTRPEPIRSFLALTIGKGWCPGSDLNQRPTAYEAVALPLSYRGDATGRFLAGSSVAAKLFGMPTGTSPRSGARSCAAPGPVRIDSAAVGTAQAGVRQERVSKAPQRGHRERHSWLSPPQAAQT